MSKNKDISRFLSLILRHKPETIGIKLDENGWANVTELLNKINKGVTFEMLEEIVETNDKKRFAFNEDKTKIRASQGHSVKVDLELMVLAPPNILYHGTADRFVDSIINEGIKVKSRTHVHLSDNYETAVNVGSRHGRVVVLEIDAKRMWDDGYKFYLSENKVWLADGVPSKYINEL